MPYKLASTLKAHSSDVRALASPTDNLVLSASRDCTVIAWTRQSASSPFTPSALYKAGTGYVNSIAYLPPSESAPQGYVAAGGQDTVINIFSLASASKEDPDFTLLGHTQNVCALNAASTGNTIISGSWDKTAKVWKDFQLAYELKGHEQSVWAVLVLEDNHYLTGSADKTIKLWNQHKNIQTFRGHQDAVRGLALVPDIGFASCSNDSEIRVWTLGGDEIYSLSGHTSFVYSLSVLPNGDIVSGGEDRTVRVWQDGECVQTIVHPAISVWAVSTMPNGDIVSGCSDGIIRVFSVSGERWASEPDLKAYNDQIASQALPTQQVGDVKKSDLPGPEALATPGKKSGEVKMILNGDIVEAHQWDSAAASWQKVGDVVEAVGQGRKQLYEGKEYDYVFDVDISEGAPPLKLPYNVTENPYGAAQRFLERNDLPLAHVDTIVQFIEKNTAGVNIGTGNNDYVDPFTGASRYRASAGSFPTTSPAATPSSFIDPYTGASRYSGTPQTNTPSPAPTVGVIPFTKFLHFKQATVSAMRTKLYQFDDAFRHEISTYSLALYPDQQSLLDETFAYLTQAVASSTSSPSSPIGQAHLGTVIQILDRWPPSQRFPIIDLSRLIAGYCGNAFNAPGLRERFFEALFKASEWTSPWAAPLPKHRETNVLLVLRTIANIFQEETPLDAGGWVILVLEALNQAPYQSLTKSQRVALTTVLFNLSCVNLQKAVDLSARSVYVTLILRVLELEKADSEAVYRALIALGNVAHSVKTSGQTLDDVSFTQAQSLVLALPTTFPEDRIRNVGVEVGRLLK